MKKINLLETYIEYNVTNGLRYHLVEHCGDSYEGLQAHLEKMDERCYFMEMSNDLLRTITHFVGSLRVRRSSLEGVPEEVVALLS